MRYIAMGDLLEFGVRLLTAKGVPDANARYVTEQLVRTEAFGVKTHGLAVLKALDTLLDNGLDAHRRKISHGLSFQFFGALASSA